MSDGDKYNGWTNYETWCVNLWMDNDQGSQEYWQERAQDALDEAEGDKSEARWPLAKELEEYHAENEPEGLGDVYADMLRHSFARVNWAEIAESQLADLTYEGDAE